MFILSTLIGVVVFLIALLKIFKVRQHPYTILAFSGAINFSIVAVEIIHAFHLEWTSFVVLPVVVIVAWYAYSLFKKIGDCGAKEIILKSLIPTLFIFFYLPAHNIWFIFPLFIMAICTHILTPKHIVEKRRKLFL